MDENSDREGEMDFDKADFGGDESSLSCAALQPADPRRVFRYQWPNHL